MKRHESALAISDGACNPSGIALTLVDAVMECRKADGHAETDPAVCLIVSQLAYLTGVWDGISNWQNISWTFESARKACRLAIAQERRQGSLEL